MDFPQSALDSIRQQLALMGRIGATRIRVTPQATFPAGSTISNAVTVKFNEHGYLLSLQGVEKSAVTAFSYANTAVRILINGDEDMVTDGQGGPSYLSFLAGFGGQQIWLPIMREVEAGDVWQFIFNNTSGAGVIPEITANCIMTADVEKMAQRRAERARAEGR